VSTIERAIALAALAHVGQVDKAGAPYILHPLRVMLRLEGMEERIVAALHDVVEDSDWTLERLRNEGFSEIILQAIDAVSRRPDEDYNEFIVRASKNSIGSRVKLADLEDNSDLSRLTEVTDRDLARLRKYQRGIAILQATGVK
jgi:(p)ppGpp synthase/HD superfamily hydrolase